MFYRPIKFQFKKESKEVIDEGIHCINTEIENLNPLILNSNSKIEFVTLLTMVDNKICNQITESSSAMRCYICQAKPTEMNDLELINSKPWKPMKLYIWNLIPACIDTMHGMSIAHFIEFILSKIDRNNCRNKKTKKSEKGICTTTI